MLPRFPNNLEVLSALEKEMTATVADEDNVPEGLLSILMFTHRFFTSYILWQVLATVFVIKELKRNGLLLSKSGNMKLFSFTTTIGKVDTCQFEFECRNLI